MKRAELEQVRKSIEKLIEFVNDKGAIYTAVRGMEALALIDAELAKPEAREYLQWGVQYNDMGPSGLVDTEIYRNTEREAREIAANDPRRKLFTRTEVQGTPAGPWERAE